MQEQPGPATIEDVTKVVNMCVYTQMEGWKFFMINSPISNTLVTGMTKVTSHMLRSPLTYQWANKPPLNP